ncbi:MAG: transposase [Candidatus Bathyarchaeota archaeon]
MDSTHIWVYSNKFDNKTCQCKEECQHHRDYSDLDARWVYKSKDYSFSGYKAHLIVDAKAQLPLDVKVTPAHEADSTQAKPLLMEARKRHPEINIDLSFMNSAYD